jgi:Transposase domain (DUF772)
VRGRIDIKYALSLDLTDPGFDASVLSEFRARLITGHAEEQLLSAMLTLFKERGWLKARGKQRTDSTHGWPRFAPSIASSVSEKRCVMRSTVWRLWHRSGCVNTAGQSGWIAMAYAWKTRDSPLEKKSARSGSKVVGKMEPAYSAPSVSQRLPPGDEKCQPSRWCGGCGSRTISGAKAS